MKNSTENCEILSNNAVTVLLNTQCPRLSGFPWEGKRMLQFQKIDSIFLSCQTCSTIP